MRRGGLDTHHCSAGSTILDRVLTLEAGLDPMIDISFAADVVGRHAIVWHADDRFFPTAPSEFASVIPEGLADTLDIIKYANLTTDELTNPNRHGVGTVPSTADVEERLDR